LTKHFKTISNSQGGISSIEACNAKPRSGGNGTSVVRNRAGKPRGPRSMGRYPFKAYVNRFFEETPYAPSTEKEMRRRFVRMEKDFLKLVENKKAKSANPEKISERDVLAYLDHLKAGGMRPGGTLHNLDGLNSLLMYVGNASVETVKRKHKRLIPKATKQRLPSMKTESLERLFDAASRVDEKDWTRLEAYALVVTSVCSGARPKEIRMCKLSDLDMSNSILHFEHVKGEGNWGEPRDSLVMVQAKPILERYLPARERMVARYCPGNEALFPAVHDRGDGYLCGNSLNKMREVIKADTGIDFDMRSCRRTFGQSLIDQGVPMETVSRLLGHATTKTTETYYCRKQQSVAIAEAKQILASTTHNTVVGAEKMDLPRHEQKDKTPLIERKEWVPGYA
jgi:integrase/recombinase XerD